MQRKIIPWSLLLICVLLGVLLAWQFRMPSFARSDDPLGQVEDQQHVLELLRTEQSSLKEKIILLRTEIEEQSARVSQASQKEYLDELRGKLALTEKTGAGVTIYLEDSALANFPNLTSYDALIVHAADLRDIVQRLWAGGATDLAINGQRITALSPLTCVGQSILVNDSRMIPPFEIVALGDPEILTQEMNLERYLPSIANRVRSGELKIRLVQSEKLSLPIFSGKLSRQFLTIGYD